MKPKASSICQVEIPYQDKEASLRFYAEVFGWPALPMEVYPYLILEIPEDFPYGISLVPRKDRQEGRGVTLYISCESLESKIRLAERFGGKLLSPPRKVPGYGEVCHIQDPCGTRWGLFAIT